MAGKIQKTFYLQRDLCTLVEAHADRLGSSFTKVVTAALLQHLMRTVWGADPMWMPIAVKLDKGDCDIAEAFRLIAQKIKDHQENDRSRCEHIGIDVDKDVGAHEREDDAHTADVFMRLAEQKDPIAVLLEGWDQFGVQRTTRKPLEEGD